jgi:flagellar protein FliO/FliZ
VQQLRPTPPTVPTAATVAPPNPAADQSLAEMAQRLEAALRRPMAQKVVAAETPRITATLDVKAITPKGAAPAKPQPGNLEQEMASLLSKPGKT